MTSETPASTLKAARFAAPINSLNNMNKKQQLDKRRAIIAASIKERTHKNLSVKMPIDFADKLKKEAGEKRMLLSGYVLSLIEKGKEKIEL